MKNFAQFSYLLFCLALFLSLFFGELLHSLLSFWLQQFLFVKKQKCCQSLPGSGSLLAWVCATWLPFLGAPASTLLAPPSLSLSLCLLFAQNTPRPGSTSHSPSTFEWSIPSSTCTFPAKSNEILFCLRLKFKFYMHERMKESNEKERECERNENKRGKKHMKILP